MRGVFESALEGDLLAGERRIGQQFLALVDFQFQQILRRGEPDVLPEEPAEPRVAHADARGDLLAGEVAVEVVLHDDLRLVELCGDLHVFECGLHVLGVGESQQQVDDAGQNLLEAAALLLRRAQRQFVEIDDILVITDVEKRPVRVEELRADLAVDVGAGESDPVLVPAGLGRGAVAVPLAGEEQDELAAALEGGLLVRSRHELPVAARDVDQLVLVEQPSLFDRKEVADRMV